MLLYSLHSRGITSCWRDNEGEGMKVVKGLFVILTSTLAAGSMGGNTSDKKWDKVSQMLITVLRDVASLSQVNDSFSTNTADGP